MPGARLTKVSFRGMTRNFHTSKEGYIWLIDKFLAVEPGLLEIDWQREFVTKGRVYDDISLEAQRSYLRRLRIWPKIETTTSRCPGDGLRLPI